jgi:hypothetical protein
MDCGLKAWASFTALAGLEMVFLVSKWAFLGLYLGCESATIVSSFVFGAFGEHGWMDWWVGWANALVTVGCYWSLDYALG